MSFPLRLGYKAAAEQFGPVELLELAVKAEAAGFDSVMASDHFQPWRHHDGHAPFSLSWLGAAGARTNRILLGTSVLTPTFRYNPAVVAQAFATLGCLFPGRIILGVGSGESLNETPVTGGEWPPFKERFGRLKEAVQLIRQLWTGERVSFEGSYYKTRLATIYDRPNPLPPIHVAAGGEKVAEYAGEIADGFICTSGKGMPLYADVLLPAVARGAEATGRNHQAIEKTIEIKVSFDLDRGRALADTRIWSALSLSPEEKAGIDDPMEMERRAEAVADRAHERWLVSDDPDEHLEQLAPYLDLGFTHLIFHAPGNDQARFLDLYSKLVLPRLRARWG
ncbi:MAG TPA: glucose-6-phosphate dehydrogenase (coenzyme-F420) [Candidatus Dormibacteraeota bacterium]|nr:glucose-6-phosphate dehydrogenase (coenzyme-F420) [Candidatus Dormibacteraeota bacterium]